MSSEKPEQKTGARVSAIVTVGRMEGEAGKRARILRRDCFRCVYCSVPYPADQLTLDHVEPRVKGGDASEGNLVTCCRECNRAKAGEAITLTSRRKRSIGWPCTVAEVPAAMKACFTAWTLI